MSVRKLTCFACLSACLFFSGIQAVGQSTTATFVGIVADSSGGSLSGAEVTLVNERTGVVRKLESNEAGEFVFSFLEIGSYAVRIVFPGFKMSEATGLRLESGQSLRRVFSLEVGDVAERVVVTAEAPLLNAVSVEQRESISTREITELPVARRSLASLFTLTSGATDNGGLLVLNGSSRKSASLTVDGVDASEDQKQPSASFNGGFNYITMVSMEAVQEVQVSKGVYSAEFGQTVSGNVNVVTKSGTNQLHGSLFHLFTSDELTARNPFLTSEVPGLTFNQFGGSLGGALIRDKLFLFGAYEGYQERAFGVVQGNVPSPRLRRDMIAAVPAYAMVLNAFPLPNQPGPENLPTGYFIGPGTRNGSDNHIVIKPDWYISDNYRVSGTYVRGAPDQLQPSISPENGRLFDGSADRFSIAFTTFRSRWNSETRFGYNRNLADRIDGFFNKMDPAKPESAFGGRRVPTLSALAFGFVAEGLEYGSPQRTLDQRFVLNLNRHTLKVGGSIFFRQQSRASLSSPDFNYSNEADLLANIPNRSRFTFGVSPFVATAKEWAFYFQDDWRVSRRLVLNMGLRYDYFSNYTANASDGSGGPPHLYNPDGILDSSFRIGPYRPVDNPYERDAMNFGPRFGFAWDLDNKGKTVIRGGFGAMFNPVIGDIILGRITNGPTEPIRVDFSKVESQNLRIAYPYYNEDVLPLVQGGAAPSSFPIIDPQVRAPYSLNYSFSVQRAISPSMVLETGFVGNRGVKFFMQRDYNQVDRITGRRPNPAIGQSNYMDNSDSTHYASWQTSLRQRYARNLLFNVHYTWGKTLSYGNGGFGGASVQDYFDIRSNRGRMEFDFTHIFVTDFVYDLPRLIGKSAPVQLALGGWQLTGVIRASTGRPLNISQSTSSISGQRPDVVDPSRIINQNRGDGLQYLNPAAFGRVPLNPASGAPIRPGNLGRSAVPGLGMYRIDSSIGKSFFLREGVQLQFRLQMLNAFNHPIYTNVNTNIDSPQFGLINGAENGRTTQINLRLSF